MTHPYSVNLLELATYGLQLVLVLMVLVLLVVLLLVLALVVVCGCGCGSRGYLVVVAGKKGRM